MCRYHLVQAACLLAVAVFLSTPAQGDPSEPTGTSVSDSTPLATQENGAAKRILQGSVEHSESLPSLDESLRPGAKYKEDVLLKLGTAANNDWFWIPSWYAGKRHTDEALIVYRYDFSTGATTTPMQRQLERNWK